MADSANNSENPQSEQGQVMLDSLKKFARIRIGHEAAMLDDARQVLRDDRAAVRKHSELPVEVPDDMLNLGDIHIEDKRQIPASGMGTLGKLLLGGALVATGAGGAAGYGLIANALTSGPQTPPLQVQPAPIDTDTDTQYELRLFPEGEGN